MSSHKICCRDCSRRKFSLEIELKESFLYKELSKLLYPCQNCLLEYFLQRSSLKELKISEHIIIAEIYCSDWNISAEIKLTNIVFHMSVSYYTYYYCRPFCRDHAFWQCWQIPHRNVVLWQKIFCTHYSCNMAVAINYNLTLFTANNRQLLLSKTIILRQVSEIFIITQNYFRSKWSRKRANSCTSVKLL